MIRAYHPSDKNQLLALLNLNIPRFFDPAEAADFAEYLENHREDYFVVVQDGVLVGCGGINYFLHESTARLSWDIIHPGYQGKGIGRELTLHRINAIRNKPAIKTIMVRTTQWVYPFYEKMGFELEKTEKDFWAQGLDLYLMKRPASD
jgi:[ribosomal protein S18]-alanine N-acetyltransferase